MKRSRSDVPKVLIIVVNYNGLHLLREHLASVVSTTYPNYDIVVVDNASTDGSVAYVKENYPKVKILINEENLGFGRANNRAFRDFPDYDLYALLNNDMEVTSGWLTPLVEEMQKDDKIGAIGPLVLYRTKRDGKTIVNSAGGVIDKFDRPFDRYEGCPLSPLYEKIDEVDWVTGGAVVYRREVLEETGGYDERMFFYYEDTDICLRMKLLGWKTFYNGNSRVVHDHMATMKKTNMRKINIMANRHRLLSIARRRGWLIAFVERFRYPLEWLLYRVYANITGTTYRDMLVKKMYRCEDCD